MPTSLYVLILLGASMAAAQAPAPQDEVLRLVNAGQYLTARELVTRLIREAAESSPPVGIPYSGGLHQLLGLIENSLGRHREAQETLEQGLKLCEAHQPAVPGLLISILVSLAESHIARAEVHQGSRLLRRALATASTGLPPDHPRMASVLDAVGLLHQARGQNSRAESFHRRALTILEKSLGPAHPDTAAVALTLGALLLSSNRSAEAAPLIEASWRALQQARGKGHPITLLAAHSFALAKLKSHPSEAESVLRASLALWRESQPEKHTTTANFLNGLAAARIAQGDAADAINLNAQALDILREVLGPEHPEVVRLLYDRFDCSRETSGRRKRQPYEPRPTESVSRRATQTRSGTVSTSRLFESANRRFFNDKTNRLLARQCTGRVRPLPFLHHRRRIRHHPAAGAISSRKIP